MPVVAKQISRKQEVAVIEAGGVDVLQGEVALSRALGPSAHVAGERPRISASGGKAT